MQVEFLGPCTVLPRLTSHKSFFLQSGWLPVRQCGFYQHTSSCLASKRRRPLEITNKKRQIWFSLSQNPIRLAFEKSAWAPYSIHVCPPLFHICRVTNFSHVEMLFLWRHDLFIFTKHIFFCLPVENRLLSEEIAAWVETLILLTFLSCSVVFREMEPQIGYVGHPGLRYINTGYERFFDFRWPLRPPMANAHSGRW